ncbi:olfactory receptor 14A2-like [Tachyglossus aculeatus]|uniref:olfactory receptor 14A2-like n=1 Tax=Tachyglossus aculeatus TaxID=9261 RepID=UPI0018F46964|nr:olfactory receptor 14A2-like [Tachyglossus aculeatus]
MSFDSYTAICIPKRYEVLMKPGVCGKMAVDSWFSGGLFGVLRTTSTFSLSFCGFHVVHHFFWDLPSLLKITCSEDHSSIDASITFDLTIGAIGSISTVVSYVRIFWAVLRMPAAKGRSKSISTCLPHLGIVTVFLFSSVFRYLKPPSHSSSVFDLLMYVFYAVMSSTLNLLIYSLRYQALKAARWTALKRCFPQTLL